MHRDETGSCAGFGPCELTDFGRSWRGENSAVALKIGEIRTEIRRSRGSTSDVGRRSLGGRTSAVDFGRLRRLGGLGRDIPQGPTLQCGGISMVHAAPSTGCIAHR